MSTAVVTQTDTRYTPDDLLAMPDGKCYELVDGRLVGRHMGARSSRVGTRLASRLDLFCENNDLGIVWGADNGYQCFPHALGMVRKPDVSFIKRGRLPGDDAPEGWISIPPALAVEVVSPNDTAEQLAQKLRDYRKGDVPLIWVIYPETRMAVVVHRDGSSVELGEDDELTGEEVILGFRVALREILPRRPAAEEPHATPAGPNGPGPA